MEERCSGSRLSGKKDVAVHGCQGRKMWRLSGKKDVAVHGCQGRKM